MTNTHKLYELAKRAYCNTSFSPDVRAESFCARFDAEIAELQELGIEQRKIDKYEALTIAHLNTQSRCISSMITGPANFPVRRAERTNSAERNASTVCYEYYNKIVGEAKQEAYYKVHPEARPILSSDADAIERLKEKLLILEAHQTKMKQANKLIRAKDIPALVVLMGSESLAAELQKPDFCGRVGFADFYLINNNAKIKATKERIEKLEKRKATAPKDLMINGVRCLENTETMRLQLFFDGKPPQATITVLKSHGFKWAPSVMAWQRQLTNNAVYSFNHFILPVLKETA